MKIIEQLTHPDFKMNDVLGTIGLEQRKAAAERILPVLALVGGGALVGAPIGFLFAPKAGKELRADISKKVGELGVKGYVAGRQLLNMDTSRDKDQDKIGSGERVFSAEENSDAATRRNPSTSNFLGNHTRSAS